MAEHKASCQCGSLVIEASNDPDIVIACNCRECQNRTGSVFATIAYFRKDDLTISGPRSTWSRSAESGRGLEYDFCPTCGTTLYWTLDMRPDHAGVAVGSIKTGDLSPSRAIWLQEKHDWVVFPDAWEQHAKGSPVAAGTAD